MLNILGGSTPGSHLRLRDRALSISGAKVHLYGKGPGRKGRKMGHITVTAPTMFECEKLLQPLVDLSKSLDCPPENLLEPATLLSNESLKFPPLIGVFMGSDSDLKTLMPGLQLLRDFFRIHPRVEIVSAHRTPDYMSRVASHAARDGLKVIIAVAGGAAHLPGMIASHTTLPVIGLPAKGSTLDGVDSLYSIVQMPRGRASLEAVPSGSVHSELTLGSGVPVATVGISNSINAALLAVRLLGSFDDSLQKKLEEYAGNARQENIETKGSKMRELGWQEYFDHMQI